MPDQASNLTTEPVDLTNCEREPIQFLGQVQSYGCLVAVSADWMVTHASENCTHMIGAGPDKLVGSRLVDFLPESSIHHLRTQMQVLSFKDGAVRVFSYPLFQDERVFDISIHKGPSQFVFEFEPREGVSPRGDDASTVQALIARVQRHDTITTMANEAARGLKMLSGFDRVMVYKFEEDDSGTVIAEAREHGMEPFLGLRYPASDIPPQARALYKRSLLRLIADVNGETSPVLPATDPNGQPLDLSLAVTRAVSPIHLEYLRNMGVEASMSVSIIARGKLWGLFACHNNTPHYINYEKRSAVELFAQLFNYELAQAEMTTDMAEMDQAQALHDGLMAQLSSDGDILSMFDLLVEDISGVIPFDGAAIYSDGKFRSVGMAPTEDEFIGLARFLNTAPAAQIYATDKLGARYPKAEEFSASVAGALALPISRMPRDYLVLFRQEIAQSVNWAGDPNKPVTVGPNGVRLTPRKSFDLWQEIVRGQSTPWKKSELRAADALRVTLLEVVLKMADESNALRKRAQDQQELLIAELNHRVRNILNLIRGLVSQSDDSATSVEAFRAMLDARVHALARAHDQLTQTEWDWVSLNELIETEVQAYLAGKTARMTVEGDRIELTPNAFTTVALVVHELVTNSAKYGALSDSRGTVSVTIKLHRDGSAELKWREKDGPVVKAPTRKGFGTTIIERSIPYELKGKAETRYRSKGFEADFVLPAGHVRKSTKETRAEHAAPELFEVAEAELSGTALVVEDNLIIAMDAVDMLGSLGAANVKSASGIEEALAILDSEEISFALLDVNLGNNLSLPVVERCIEMGIPVMLASGYGGKSDVLADFPDVPMLKKPYTIETMRAAIAKLDGGNSSD